MRRVVCNAFGPLEDLVVEDGPEPQAADARVVVEVRAAGVNFVDALFVRGRYQIKPPVPFTPGGEIAGVVKAVGAGVEGFSPGDRVIASTGLGGFASHVLASPSSLFPLPDEVSFGVGAVVVQSYATAVYSLTRCTRIEQGEWVLVLGAGGGVGRASVDVARSLGGRVIGVASTADKRELALEAGAERVIDAASDVKTEAREISGGGVHVVVDPVGGELAEAALRALRWGGRFLVVGFVAGIPRIPLNLVLLNSRSAIGVEWGAWAMRNPEDNRSMLLGILDDVAAGRLHPAEPAALPLEKAADVLRDIEERRVTGKVVLVP